MHCIQVSLVNYEVECVTPTAASESENSSGHSTPREPSIGSPEVEPDEPIVFTASSVSKPCECHRNTHHSIVTEVVIEQQQQQQQPSGTMPLTSNIPQGRNLT